jgi:hypothetical protein
MLSPRSAEKEYKRPERKTEGNLSIFLTILRLQQNRVSAQRFRVKRKQEFEQYREEVQALGSQN